MDSSRNNFYSWEWEWEYEKKYNKYAIMWNNIH